MIWTAIELLKIIHPLTPKKTQLRQTELPGPEQLRDAQNSKMTKRLLLQARSFLE